MANIPPPEYPIVDANTSAVIVEVPTPLDTPIELYPKVIQAAIAFHGAEKQCRHCNNNNHNKKHKMAQELSVTDRLRHSHSSKN